MVPVPSPSIRAPVVAIVGRPNVGKSTLLNALCGSRVAIVQEQPGVTRDRVGVRALVEGREVEFVDTGGLGPSDEDTVAREVRAQVARAIAVADLILFVVDVRQGRTSLDEEVARLLRRRRDAVLLLANKAERTAHVWDLAEFESLGMGEARPISAKEKSGLMDLQAEILARLPDRARAEDEAQSDSLTVRLALVGRVNAGKSSLVNALLGEERMIVSEEPGTTRDAVDLVCHRGEVTFVLIDTAGVRKEQRVHGSVDFYAQRRAEKALRRADVAALVLDAAREVGRLDRQIAAQAAKSHLPLLLVANKWDLGRRGRRQREFAAELKKDLPAAEWAPLLFTCAVTSRNTEQILQVARRLFGQARQRVSTGPLNRALQEAWDRQKPRPQRSRLGRVYYGSQIDVAPPTFLLFVNDPALFGADWIRFLEHRLREAFPFPDVPLRIQLRARERDDRGPPG